MKHSLTRMHRILWTASMQEILRRMLSLLASVLFSIPLPLKFSIPRSLEIAFNQEALTAKKITDQDKICLCCTCISCRFHLIYETWKSHLPNMKILLIKHKKQGLFRAVDTVVVSQIWDFLHSSWVHLQCIKMKIFDETKSLLIKQLTGTSFISLLWTLKSSAVIQRRTYTDAFHLYVRDTLGDWFWSWCNRKCE